MSSPLEKFILENREKFDADPPNPSTWEKIAARMDLTEEKKKAPVRSLPFKRWLSAAAVLIAAGLTLLLYYSRQQAKPQTALAQTKPVKTEPSRSQPNNNPVIARPDSSKTTLAPNTNPDATAKTSLSGENTEPAETGENKELYYYSKLIELKHEELKGLEKDEPLLYKQFAGDVKKLDSVYHTLQSQLPQNSNREQVIEALITNLQLQIGLLNKQLNIIRQIKHSKKSAYEKAYQSV